MQSMASCASPNADSVKQQGFVAPVGYPRA